MTKHSHHLKLSSLALFIGILLSGCGGQEELIEEFTPPETMVPPSDPDITDPDITDPDINTKWGDNNWGELTWS